MIPVSGFRSTRNRTVGESSCGGYPTGVTKTATWSRNGSAFMMSRARTLIADEIATNAMQNRNAHAMPTGRRTTLGDSVPVTAALTRAARVLTPMAGKEATSAAVGKASRGHGVSLINRKLDTIDALPMVMDAWKNAQTPSPTNANTTYGTPEVSTPASPL